MSSNISINPLPVCKFSLIISKLFVEKFVFQIQFQMDSFRNELYHTSFTSDILESTKFQTNYFMIKVTTSPNNALPQTETLAFIER